MKWKNFFLVTLTVMLFMGSGQQPANAQSANYMSSLGQSDSPDPNVPVTPRIDDPVGDPSSPHGDKQGEEEEPSIPPVNQPGEDPSAPPIDQPEDDQSSPPAADPVENEEQIALPMAGVDDTTIVMYPGESYAFTNNDTSAHSIITDASTSKGITYDSVKYKPDGSFYTAYMNKIGSLTVSGGYTAVITVTGMNAMTVTLKPELSYTVSSEPALIRMVLSFGDSYRFMNNSSDSVSILSDSSSSEDRYYDYATYKETGELNTSDFKSVGKPSVPAGGEIILTSVGGNAATVAVPYGIFTGEVSAEPAYARVTLNQGDSYQFTNLSGKSDTIESDGTTKDKFDYVVYLPDGTEISRGTNTSVEPTISSGRYCILTQVTATPVTFGVPNRTFDVQRAGGEAISRITVYPGESVIFHNNGSLSNPIKNDASSSNGEVFDYVIYKADGALYSNDFNSTSKPNITSLGYGLFTVAGALPVVFDYTDDFSVEYTSDPAFHRITLNKGESVTFINRTGSTEFLDSDASITYKRLFDYVTYFPDGTERSRGKETAVEPGVPAGHKVVVTGASDTPVTMGAIYTVFDVEDRPNEAISQITVSPGESVIFHNGGSLSNPIRNNASRVGGIYDYVMYKTDGNVYSDKFNQDSSGPNVPKGGEAVVSVVGNQPIVFDYTDEFTVEDSNEPAYLRVTLKRDESYAFTNISSVQEGLDSNASTTQQRLFDVVVYKADGSERSRYNSTTVNPILKPGEKAILTTASDNAVTFGAIYRSFRGQDDSGGHTIRTTIRPGQSYSFTNSSSKTLHLEKIVGTDNIVDFAVYHQNGSLSSDGFGVSSTPSIPSGGLAIVTNASKEDVIFEHSEVINAVTSIEPAFHRVTLAKGLSYQFKNISSQNKLLESDASTTSNKLFDYIIYKGDGTEGNRGTSTAVEPVVNAGDRAVITTASDSPVTYGAVYRLFEATPIDTPTETQVALKMGQSYIFQNLGTVEAAISSNASLEQHLSYDLAVYGGANQPIQANMDSTSPSVTIPPSGTAVVTVTSTGSVTFQFKKPVTAGPSTETALIKKTLAPEESVAFHNKSYYPGNILSDASSNTNTFYDFKVLDLNHNILNHGEHAYAGQSVPATADIHIFNTSEGSIAFAGPYRSFTMEEIGVEFIDLIDTVEQKVPDQKGQAVYYRFKPAFTGTYRFAIKETGEEDKTPRLVLFNDKELTEQLAASTEVEQVYGKEYTTLEWDLEASRYYYLKLDDKEGKELSAAIKAAKMNKQTKSAYEYGPADQMIKITLFTGDQILFEYDKNGNLTKRTKNIFPYFK